MAIENEGESLLDAVNAAIPSEDPPEGDETEQELPEGEEAPEGEDADGDETPEGDEGDEDAEGDDADGEETEEGEEPPPKKPAKEVDPINDPLPKGTLQSTSERFKVVVDKLKEQTTAREAVESQYNELIGEITGTGMNADSYSIMLEYARGVNSGDPVALRKSYDILMQELNVVAKALGEPLPGQNPLEGHADLIAAVDAKTLDPKIAIETALHRNRTAAAAKLQTVYAGRTQSQQQSAQAQAQGRAALTQLGKELAAADGPAEYKRKAGLVVGMLQATLPNLPPNLWVKAFRTAYAQVPKAAPVARQAVPGKKAPQPMRGNKVPSGSNAKKPKNLYEAINGAFE